MSGTNSYNHYTQYFQDQADPSHYSSDPSDQQAPATQVTDPISIPIPIPSHRQEPSRDAAYWLDEDAEDAAAATGIDSYAIGLPTDPRLPTPQEFRNNPYSAWVCGRCGAHGRISGEYCQECSASSRHMEDLSGPAQLREDMIAAARRNEEEATAVDEWEAQGQDQVAEWEAWEAGQGQGQGQGDLGQGQGQDQGQDQGQGAAEYPHQNYCNQNYYGAGEVQESVTSLASEETAVENQQALWDFYNGNWN